MDILVKDNESYTPLTSIGLKTQIYRRLKNNLFNPSKLFNSGENGVWYDPSDLTTLFQDHLGTIPAAYGQPVGLMLDKSKGGLGPELGLLGTYVKDTDAHLTIPLGGPIDSGKTYQVRFEVEGKNVSSPSVGVGSWASSIGILQTGDFTFTAAILGTGTAAVLPIQGNLARLTVRNVSVREILGNPAIQPTTTARPTLGRMPKGGRRNLLVRSEDIGSPAWTMGAHNTTTVEVLPGINGVQIEGLPQFAVYDRTNSVWIIPSTDWPVTSGRFSATFTAPAGCYVANLYLSRGTSQIYSSATNSVVEPGETYTISMHVNGDKVGGVQYERGAVMTPYQRVGASAFDVTEQGVPSLNYLYRDPVDDVLPWTAPAGSYDIFHVGLSGTVTILASQSLSGATNILLSENTSAYLAINRRLSAAEINSLRAYYGVLV